MTTKGVADIVFCLDASDSMRPCFEGIRKHIGDFIGGIESASNIAWDWRVDYVAHSAGDDCARLESLRCDSQRMVQALYHENAADRFFTTDLNEFRRGLSQVELIGDEAPLIALDCCLDFPWREATHCHRVVVMMTDEPFETGTVQQEQLTMLPTLIEKIQRLRVMLYLVAPESAAFDELAAVEKSEYEVIDRVGNGMADVNFQAVLTEIGKSVSVCDWQMPAPEAVPRGIFNQAMWTEGGQMSMHDRT